MAQGLNVHTLTKFNLAGGACQVYLTHLQPPDMAGFVSPIEEDPEYKKGRDYAIRRLGKRECSVGDLRRKLAENGISAEVAEKIIENLAQNNWVSDERFSRMLVRQQMNRANGPRLIQQKLKAQGISLSTEKLKEIASEVSDKSDVDTARNFVARKNAKAWEDRKVAARASQALLRRGFSYSVIQDVLRKIHDEDESGSAFGLLD